MESVALKRIHKVIDFPRVVKRTCIKCHKEIDLYGEYCPYCGKKQTTKEKYQPKQKFEVYPFKDIAGLTTEEWVDKMQDNLLNRQNGAKRFINRRNYMMFTVGIDIGLRASDLTALKVSDFMYANWVSKSQSRIIEQKTGKARDVFYNDALKEAVREYILAERFKYNDYIFPSNKKDSEGNYRPLEVDNWNFRLRESAKEIGYPLRIGSHSVRKTYGYQIYMKALSGGDAVAQRALAILCQLFGHSSPAITLRYIGIDEEEKIELNNQTASSYDRYLELSEE